MSIPNDKEIDYMVGQQIVRARSYEAACKLALEQEKANAEKIGATVQAARASATQPLFEKVTEPVSPDDYNTLVATLQSTIESLGDQLINRTKQQRHVLQAEVNYYKQAHKNDVKQLGQTIDRLSDERDALQAEVNKLTQALSDEQGLVGTLQAQRDDLLAALEVAGSGEGEAEIRLAIARATSKQGLGGRDAESISTEGGAGQ